MPNNFKNVADQIVAKANKEGMGAYIHHVATTGIIYIRFKDPRMAQISIGDHDGREALKYKYNVRSDVSTFHKEKDGDVWRWYFPLTMVSMLIEELKQRAHWIKSQAAPAKYQYGQPAYKRKKHQDPYRR